MGAIVVSSLFKSRLWNRCAIPIHVFGHPFNIPQYSLLPTMLIEIENQTSAITKISSHPATDYLTDIERKYILTYLDDLFILLAAKSNFIKNN
jgi:hypothetical protein